MTRLTVEHVTDVLIDTLYEQWSNHKGNFVDCPTCDLYNPAKEATDRCTADDDLQCNTIAKGHVASITHRRNELIDYLKENQK